MQVKIMFETIDPNDDNNNRLTPEAVGYCINQFWRNLNMTQGVKSFEIMDDGVDDDVPDIIKRFEELKSTNPQ